MNWEAERTAPDPETKRGRDAMAVRLVQLEAAVHMLRMRVERLEGWRLAVVVLAVLLVCSWLERIGK